MPVHTYNLKDVFLSVNGVPIEGFGENDAIQLEFAEDFWTITKGADGETSRSCTNNGSGTIRITLMQMSQANAILQSAFLADKRSGRATFAIVLEHLENGEVIIVPVAWIVRSPNKQWNKAIGEREWMLQCADITESPLTGLDFGFIL